MNKTGVGGFKDHPENANHAGQRNAQAVAFTRALRLSLVSEGEQLSHNKKLAAQGTTRYQSMIIKVWNLAERGVPWAVDYISERVEGKVTQPIGNDGTGKLTIEIIRESAIATAASTSGTATDQE